MSDYVKRLERASTVLRLRSPVTNLPLVTDVSDKTESDKKLDQLMDQFAEMKLLLNRKQTAPKITCFNCGEEGHGVRMCTKPENAEAKQKRLAEWRAKKDLPNQVENVNILLPAIKRVRVDDLINDDDEGGQPRKPLVKTVKTVK